MKKLIDNISKGAFPALIGISALSVSASAAFYSVSGLSKLFAGASFEVIIMAGSLEVSKLVIASLLYRYWTTINKILRTYLTIATLILVVITSMGIYGFLSAAYQDTYRQLTMKNNQTAFLEQKKDFYQKDVTRYDEELERISGNISTLSSAKATSIQVRDTTSSTGFRSTISTTELRLAQSRITAEEENRKSVQAKREVAADSLQKYQLAILDLENNTEVAGELGPLEYLANLTGVGMDQIINYLLLIIIFVFDPLAISLVIAANFAFEQAFPKRKEEEMLIPDIFEGEVFEEYEPESKPFKPEKYEGAEWLPEIKEIIEKDSELTDEELEKLYAIYGESGSKNESEEDWEITSETSESFEDEDKNVIRDPKDEIRDQLENLRRYLDRERIGGINPTLEKNLKKEIQSLEDQLKNEDDLTISY